jgi:NADH-quinone oxidoreductase subunit E
VNELLQKHQTEIELILRKYPAGQKQSALMPLVFLAQRERGVITRQSLQEIAEILEVSPTDVDSVVGFYTLFHDGQGGRYRVQVCTDLPCALRGAEEFLQQVCANLGVKVGETTPDGMVTIEEVTCLAGCHRAPLFQVQGNGGISYHENQTADSAAQVIADLRRKGGAG